MLLPMVASADNSGTCGDSLTWKLVESTGTLTISGSGAMEDYTSYVCTPWYRFRAKILVVVIEDGVTSINSGAFYECTSLTSVTIGSNVTSINSGAFYECTSLTSVTIPNSVTSIGEFAFYECSSLTSVTIPNSVTSIGNSALAYCSSLTSIFVENGNTVYDSRDNCNAIIETATNILITGCKNTAIPNSVTSIGDYAFSGCSSLTSVTIPNSVTSIGKSAFSRCSRLTLVTIPNSVTEIGRNVFQGCSRLTSITIGNSVTSIGDYAFNGCSRLTSVTIPNSVTSIGSNAFYECSRLTSVTIGNSVTSIGYYAFCECFGLTSVTIGNSVKSIGQYAFYWCTSLTDVYCYAESVPKTNSDEFDGVPLSSATLHVPAASLDTYKKTSPWEQFGTIVALTDEETAVKTIESTQQNADGKYMKNGKLIIMKKGKKYDAAGKLSAF